MEKYYVAHAGGGSYGGGHAYKIYLVDVQGDRAYIVKPITGVYFAMQKGSTVPDFKNTTFDTYDEARYYIIHDLMKNIFLNKPIFDMKKLAKRLSKSNVK